MEPGLDKQLAAFAHLKPSDRLRALADHLDSLQNKGASPAGNGATHTLAAVSVPRPEQSRSRAPCRSVYHRLTLASACIATRGACRAGEAHGGDSSAAAGAAGAVLTADRPAVVAGAGDAAAEPEQGSGARETGGEARSAPRQSATGNGLESTANGQRDATSSAVSPNLQAAPAATLAAARPQAGKSAASQSAALVKAAATAATSGASQGGAKAGAAVKTGKAQPGPDAAIVLLRLRWLLKQRLSQVCADCGGRTRMHSGLADRTPVDVGARAECGRKCATACTSRLPLAAVQTSAIRGPGHARCCRLKERRRRCCVQVRAFVNALRDAGAFSDSTLPEDARGKTAMYMLPLLRNEYEGLFGGKLIYRELGHTRLGLLLKAECGDFAQVQGQSAFEV